MTKYKVRYMRNGTLRYSLKTFKTKKEAEEALQKVKNMQKTHKLGRYLYKNLKVVRME
jgi:hypothetical protein